MRSRPRTDGRQTRPWWHTASAGAFVLGLGWISAACSAPTESVAATRAALVTRTFRPVADATVVSSYPDANDGAAPSLYTGRDARGGIRRALLRFDLTSLPPDDRATIVRARLVLRVASVPGTTPADSNLGLVRATSAWIEGGGSNGSRGMPCATVTGVTWRTRDCVHPFAVAGGDLATTTSASASTSGLGIASEFVVDSDAPGNAAWLDDLRAFRDAPCANHGFWLVSDAEATPSTARGFYAREGPEKPRLVVDLVCLPGFEGDACRPVTDAAGADDAGADDGGQDAGVPSCPIEPTDAGLDADADGAAAPDAATNLDAGAIGDAGDAGDAPDAGPRGRRADGCRAGVTSAADEAWAPLAALAFGAGRRSLRRRGRR